MFCKKCGMEINENSQFCQYCGFNQKDDVKTSKRKDEKEELVSWYMLDKAYQKHLKKEFKSIYPGNGGLEALAVICYIIGFFTALYTVGSYSIKVMDSTVASGTFISVPMLIITLFLFTVGTIAGYSSNHKFDKAFSPWLLATYKIVK